MKITVSSKHKNPIGEYIGRGSPLGNPYSHNPNSKASFITKTRDEAISLYEEYLRKIIEEQSNTHVLIELQRIYEKAQKQEVNLVCFCKPKACHGDVIRKILLEEAEKDGLLDCP